MAERCGCHDQGDETVFGQCRQCHPEPESVHASGLQRELDRLEHPYERTLAPDELED